MSDSKFIPDDCPFDGACETRPVNLADAQIELIAQRAATKAIEQMTTNAYAAIGKGVVTRFLWIVGVLTVGLFFLGAKQGWIKLP